MFFTRVCWELVGDRFVFCRLDGSTLGKDRQKLVDDFNNSPSLYIFLISTKAGGLGLNLTSANKVVVFDPNWSALHHKLHFPCNAHT